MIRTVSCPVLVATGAVFAPPRKIALAYDGSPQAQRTLVAASKHPLPIGLPLTLITVTTKPSTASGPSDAALTSLQEAQTTMLSGDPHAAIPAFVREAGIECWSSARRARTGCSVWSGAAPPAACCEPATRPSWCCAEGSGGRGQGHETAFFERFGMLAMAMNTATNKATVRPEPRRDTIAEVFPDFVGCLNAVFQKPTDKP